MKTFVELLIFEAESLDKQAAQQTEMAVDYRKQARTVEDYAAQSRGRAAQYRQAAALMTAAGAA